MVLVAKFLKTNEYGSFDKIVGHKKTQTSQLFYFDRMFANLQQPVLCQANRETFSLAQTKIPLWVMLYIMASF